MKSRLTPRELAGYFDQTLLKAYATAEDIISFCREAKRYGFKSVMVNPSQIARCREILVGSDVMIGTVVGFPLGQMTVESKLYEAEDAISRGADEIDYVINIGEAKSGNFDYIEDEMARMTELCHSHGRAIKVIFENCYLNENEKRALCAVARRVRPDFIKTSTGFGTPASDIAVGATVEDIKLMHSEIDGMAEVKAAGGVRTLAEAIAVIEAGATRIGTSAGAKIIEELTASLKA